MLLACRAQHPCTCQPSQGRPPHPAPTPCRHRLQVHLGLSGELADEGDFWQAGPSDVPIKPCQVATELLKYFDVEDLRRFDHRVATLVFTKASICVALLYFVTTPTHLASKDDLTKDEGDTVQRYMNDKTQFNAVSECGGAGDGGGLPSVVGEVSSATAAASCAPWICSTVEPNRCRYRTPTLPTPAHQLSAPAPPAQCGSQDDHPHHGCVGQGEPQPRPALPARLHAAAAAAGSA